MTEPVSGWMIFSRQIKRRTTIWMNQLNASLNISRQSKEDTPLSNPRRIILLHFENQEILPFFVNNSNQGDVVECMGLDAPDQSIHIEFLRIKHLQPNDTGQVPVCNKSMASMGANQGIRCKKCGHISEDNWNETERNYPNMCMDSAITIVSSALAKSLGADETRQNNI